MEREDFLELFKIQLKKPKGESWAVFTTFDSEYPDARNVILRDLDQRSILIYTHAQSKKVSQIQERSNSNICWYSKRHGIQLQFYGQAKIADLETIKEHQTKVRNFRDYQGGVPGSDYLSKNITSEIHFSVIEFHINKMVALKLGRDEHLKYEFLFGNDDQSRRLIP